MTDDKPMSDEPNETQKITAEVAGDFWAGIDDTAARHGLTVEAFVIASCRYAVNNPEKVTAGD